MLALLIGQGKAGTCCLPLPALLLPVLFLSACETADLATQKKMARMFQEDQRRTEASIIAERNGPPIARADYRRLTATLALKREREQTELARYARFQMDQKLALAQASAGKMLIASPNGISAPQQVSYRYRKVRAEQATVQESDRAALSEGDYPDRFYTRQVQENSVAQAEAEAAATAASSSAQGEGDAPYAVPVPGKPGFVTIPPKMGGYIDVRGYAPGSLVMDPWTKSIVRVP